MSPFPGSINLCNQTIFMSRSSNFNLSKIAPGFDRITKSRAVNHSASQLPSVTLDLSRDTWTTMANMMVICDPTLTSSNSDFPNLRKNIGFQKWWGTKMKDVGTAALLHSERILEKWRRAWEFSLISSNLEWSWHRLWLHSLEKLPKTKPRPTPTCHLSNWAASETGRRSEKAARAVSGAQSQGRRVRGGEMDLSSPAFPPSRSLFSVCGEDTVMV